MEIRIHRRAAALALIVLGLASSAIFCGPDVLDYSGTRHGPMYDPALSVEPVPVCPGETVTVSWDVGPQREDCSDGRLTADGSPGLSSDDRTFCTEIVLTSTDAAHDTTTGRFELEGQLDFVLRRDTTFAITAHYDPEPDLPTERTASVEARVRDPLPEDIYPIQGHCEGSTPVWPGLNLRELYGPCTRIGPVCNQSRYTITVQDDLGGRVVLGPAGSDTACTDLYSGTAGDLRPVLTVTAVDYSVLADPRPPCPDAVDGGNRVWAISLSVGLSCMPFDEAAGACTGAVSEPLTTAPGEVVTRDEREAVCGNGVCEPEFGEDNGLCPADCPLVAPDTSLPGVGVATCGDAVCDVALGETCALCELDCGPCVPASGGDGGDGGGCGDGICQPSESYTACPADCAPEGACGAGPGACCGDGVCQTDESPDWCGDCVPAGDGGDGGDGDGGDGGDGGSDGGGQPPVCGNGVLEKGEGCENDSHCASDQYCASNCTCDTFI